MTMPHPETYPTNQRAATRQTRRRPALRPVLKEMMDNVNNPNTNEDRESIKAQFIQFMNTAAGTQYRETAYVYWFDNNYRSLLADYPQSGKDGRPDRREAQKRHTTELKHRIEQTIEKKAQIILLDWMLPNGKALRDCTGRDCLQMSSKVGIWLRKISDHVKPTEIVGNVLQEADVRKLFGKDAP